MDVVGFSQEDLDNLFSILAAIVHLGNVQFEAAGEHADVKDRTALEHAADMLKVRWWSSLGGGDGRGGGGGQGVEARWRRRRGRRRQGWWWLPELSSHRLIASQQTSTNNMCTGLFRLDPLLLLLLSPTLPPPRPLTGVGGRPGRRAAWIYDGDARGRDPPPLRRRPRIRLPRRTRKGHNAISNASNSSSFTRCLPVCLWCFIFLRASCRFIASP